MNLGILDLWLDGKLAGHLMKGETGDVEFSYEDDYASARGVTPLSASMPLYRKSHGPRQVMPWLSNLLPDSDEVRQRWAARFAENQSDPFTLLRHVGQDAPGSVQIVPHETTPSSTENSREVSTAELARRVQAIHNDPSLWVERRDGGQSNFSLGGHQGKFAVTHRDGKWFEPSGRSASTHIVKPGMSVKTERTQEEMQAIEFVTMRASRKLGIPTALVDIHDFDGVPAFVTTRYDRITQNDGSVERVHQEDFCQALSVHPSRKYESDGGPTMRDIMSLVESSVSPSYRENNLHVMRSLFSFNLVTAGVDAHAKNSSFILSGDHILVAPAYDLISAHGLWRSQEVLRKHGPAVKYGKAKKYHEISANNIARTADTLGMSRSDFNEMLHGMANLLPSILEEVASDLPAAMQGPTITEMPVRLRTFNRSILSGVTDQAVASVPKFQGMANTPGSNQGESQVWVQGQFRGNTWVTGRYRSLPRA